MKSLVVKITQRTTHACTYDWIDVIGPDAVDEGRHGG
jgi:hypothetical protein